MGIMTLVVTLPVSFVAQWRFGRPQGTRVNIALARKPTFLLQVCQLSQTSLPTSPMLMHGGRGGNIVPSSASPSIRQFCPLDIHDNFFNNTRVHFCICSPFTGRKQRRQHNLKDYVRCPSGLHRQTKHDCSRHVRERCECLGALVDSCHWWRKGALDCVRRGVRDSCWRYIYIDLALSFFFFFFGLTNFDGGRV